VHTGRERGHRPGDRRRRRGAGLSARADRSAFPTGRRPWFRAGVTGAAGGALAAVAVLALTVATSSCDSGRCPAVRAPRPTEAQRVLLDPSSEAFREVPPDTFDVRFETTAGDFVIEVIRAWAPMGAYRFYNLVRNGFYDGNAFFRVVPGFVVQWGVSGVPEVQRAWNDETMPDDPVLASNRRGTVTFAKAGKDTRTTQIFVNYGENTRLDELGFAPFGRVVSGMENLILLYNGYGELPPLGNAPDFGCMLDGGSAYLDRRYDKLDTIRRAVIID
jgi:peptidyl-prolyl cis-trans isomerase A (cyclophilin A)